MFYTTGVIIASLCLLKDNKFNFGGIFFGSPIANGKMIIKGKPAPSSETTPSKLPAAII
ncbi:MAG: hypothetical protein FWH41_04930 [Treponema sp.]|nr:hypothetical protein [Treponema sp.]